MPVTLGGDHSIDFATVRGIVDVLGSVAAYGKLGAHRKIIRGWVAWAR